MTLSENDLMRVATRLAETAGKAPPTAMTQLKTGRNNRSFRLTVEEGQPLFLKSYFSHPADPRDRLSAEWKFLTYAWDHGIRTIPRPLAAEWETKTGLYSFIEGSQLKPGEVQSAHVEAAADFVLALNAPPRAMDALPAGSEACFALGEHIATIDRRVARLSDLDPGLPHRDRAEDFARNTLAPTWRNVKARIETEAEQAGLPLTDKLPQDEIILSPSDFGFHNVIVTPEGVPIFTDFEYAGRDDPAKLVCDFFCQPQIPVPLEHFDRFIAKLQGGITLAPAFAQRCALLLDAYRIKWTCIILNDFHHAGAAQRAFALDEAWGARCEEQLNKAQAKIAEISHP